VRQSAADIKREVSERIDILYALDKMCTVCGTRIETRQEAAHTKAIDGSEFLSHDTKTAPKGCSWN
jgi:hypothetical protein